MGDRFTHLRHRRLRSLHLQRVTELHYAGIDHPPVTVDRPLGPGSEDRPAESSGHAPKWAERVPLSEPVTESVVHPAKVVAVWTPSRLADPVGSARRVHEQLQHSGAAAAHTHADLEGVHELIGVD